MASLNLNEIIVKVLEPGISETGSKIVRYLTQKFPEKTNKLLAE